MQRLGSFFARLAQRHLPDPLALACLLTLAVGAAAVVFPQEPGLRAASAGGRIAGAARIWLAGVWSAGFLAFALQMCVVLLTGFGLARAPVARRGLARLAAWPRTNRGAVGLIAAVSCAGCWLNWGFGLIFAGVLATEVRAGLRRRGVDCQYALIVAAAYAGMMIWHGGLSGSAPLKVAEVGVRAELPDGTVREIPPLAVSATTLSGPNLLLTAVLLVGIPLTLRHLAEKGEAAPASAPVMSPPVASDSAASAVAPVGEPSVDEAPGWARRLNRSRVLALGIGGAILLGVAVQVADAMRTGGSGRLVAGLGVLNLNTVNSLFLALGLCLHPHVASYMTAVAEGGRAIAGIVVQFPLYSGIQALMFGAGLAAELSNGFVAAAQAVAGALGIAESATFPLATFASAGLVNFFVPSGGGQWIVQGPIMCGAADALHLSIPQTVMAIAYGDQLTNMVQPFWAIPLMGLTRVDARAFMGYCALLMLLAAPVMAVGLLFY